MNNFINEKRGFELALNTIVIIILAVLLLLFAVMFFTKSSGSFIDTIRGYFSYSNVDSIVQRCNILADSNSLNSFCCEKVEVRYYANGKKEIGVFSCRELMDNGIEDRIKIMDCKEVKC
ncbi:MAG: hypothetical protein PHF67_03240 [Candidatus Nanoarchaeia archaeon]|nr:hypothetical protein [Candidatus Nanoarchaeia archaeon]